jgi:putative ABC transport system permease protein
VHDIDRRLPVYSIHTLDLDVEAGISTERILGFVSSLFAALATLLSGIGLYGVLAFSVARRRREIGIRYAIGARKLDIASLFARESMTLGLVGLAIGIPLALLAARALRALLFGVGATDPMTLALSLLTLAMAVLSATVIPLRAAGKIDPMTALRYE